MSIRYLILSLTRRCNLACAYCYNGDRHSKTDMPQTVIRDAIQLVAAHGQPFHLQLTGGEPTLAPDAVQMAADLACSSGHCHTLGIQTNATCLTPELLSLFKAHAVQVGVSLDGPPAIHERQRGMAAETLQGLQRLDTAGIPFRVTTVVTRANAASLDRLVLTLAGFHHARGIGLDLLVAKGRAAGGGCVQPADAAILGQGLLRMLDVLSAVNQRREVPIRLRERDLIAGTQATSKSAFCHASLGESLAVDPDGRLFPCGQTLGDNAFFAGTIWDPQYDRLKRLGFRTPTEGTCASCQLRNRCPGDCPSRLYYNQGINSDLICTVYRTIWENEYKSVLID